MKAADEGLEGIVTSPPGDGEVEGFNLTQLQCPVCADDQGCVASALYEGWDSSVWDFGTNEELPGLIIDGFIYRDADGNGDLSIEIE